VQLAQVRESCLSEITCNCGCLKLTQARRTSLSEAEGLSWASLCELLYFYVFVSVFWLFTIRIDCICMWCDVWA